MTKNETFAAIKALGRELTVRRLDLEYRVSFHIDAIRMANPEMSYSEAQARNEDVAYYTSDAQDALDTARAMHDWYVNRPDYLKV